MSGVSSYPTGNTSLRTVRTAEDRGPGNEAAVHDMGQQQLDSGHNLTLDNQHPRSGQDGHTEEVTICAPSSQVQWWDIIMSYSGTIWRNEKTHTRRIYSLRPEPRTGNLRMHPVPFPSHRARRMHRIDDWRQKLAQVGDPWHDSGYSTMRRTKKHRPLD